MPENPLFGPFGPGTDIVADPDNAAGPCCPMCKTRDYDAYTNQYGVVRTCRKCGNEWSGGTMGAARPDFSDPFIHPGIPVPEDLPVVQYTGAAFRDPSKNSDGDW